MALWGGGVVSRSFPGILARSTAKYAGGSGNYA